MAAMINGRRTDAERFYYDGCHKIYLVEDEEDIATMESKGWGVEDLYPIKDLPYAWESSCPLRFIQNCKLDAEYVPQGYDKAVLFRIPRA